MSVLEKCSRGSVWCVLSYPDGEGFCIPKMGVGQVGSNLHPYLPKEIDYCHHQALLNTGFQLFLGVARAYHHPGHFRDSVLFTRHSSWVNFSNDLCDCGFDPGRG